MNKKEIYKKVAGLIYDLLEVEIDKEEPDATLEDLGADSLDAVELALSLEETFDIEILDKDSGRENYGDMTVKDLVVYVAKSMGADDMKKNDGLNNSFGTTKIKVFFQSGEYKGTMIYEILGNCKGMNVLPHDGTSILDCLESAKFENMSIKMNEGTADVMLTANNGDTCLFELLTESELENIVVGMQIIDFGEEYQKD